MYMIFASLAPIFLIMLAGAVTERLGVLPPHAADSINAFSVNVSFPCLLFHIMAATTPAQLAQGGWWLGTAGLQTAAMGLIYLLARRSGDEAGPAVVAALLCTFCNAGFVGLPVVLNVFPGSAEAMSAAGLMIVACNAVCVLGQMALTGWDRSRQAPEGRIPLAIPPHVRVWRALRRYVIGNCILMAAFLGLCFSLLEIPVWEPLDRACVMLGMAAPVCMLFTLGFCLRGSLARALEGHTVNVLRQVLLCSARLVVLPLLTLAALRLLGLPDLWVCVAFIISATGSAIMVATLSQFYRTAAAQAALTVAVTNLLSFFSLLAALWFLGYLGLMP